MLLYDTSAGQRRAALALADRLTPSSPTGSAAEALVTLLDRGAGSPIDAVARVCALSRKLPCRPGKK